MSELSVESEFIDVSSHAPTTQLGLVWSQFRRHKLALVGLVFLLILMLSALFGRWIMPYDPLLQNPALAMGMPQPPSPLHLLGTDALGRDLLSRVISGAQISLSVGFVAVGISLLIGITLGSLAGYYGGWADNLITRVADIFLSVPSFFLMMTANVYLRASIYNVMVIIGLFSWMSVARLIRGEILRLKEMDFISAARALGASPNTLILRHLLPNAVAPVIVSATIGIPYAILLESSLSFLGLGVPPPAASWGNLLFEARTWLNVAWWFWLPPGLLISLTVISFNFVGDGLRDAFDPTQRGR
jgi:peptide/nickel transport system permease protein